MDSQRNKENLLCLIPDRPRICHLTSVHPPFDNRIFHKECKCLAEAGYEVHLVAKNTGDQVCNGILIHALPSSYQSRLRRMFVIIWKLYKIAKSINALIYHFHDPELIPIGLLLKMKGKIVIYDTHEDVSSAILVKTWINRNIRSIVSAIFHHIEKMAVKYFDATISGHPQATLKIPTALPLYNYPDLNYFLFPKQDKTTNRKFLWLGLFTEGRGGRKILEAICNNQNLTLDIIGRIEGIKWTHERINFLGEYPLREAIQMSQNYLAGLVTYLPEPNNVNSSPNKMYEYMALGIPVIASNFSEWRSIIESGQCGICVDPENQNEIEKAMQFLLENPQSARSMGKNGRRLVEEKYNWQIERKKLLLLYYNLMMGKL